MTAEDDVYAELAHAKKMLQRRDYTAALEAIVQAEKLWSAEVLYWRCELDDMQKALDGTVRGTTEREEARIREGSHNQRVAWVDHHDAHRWAP
jgi:hypothetical protein